MARQDKGGRSMTRTVKRLRDYAPRPAHLRWLLDSDPAIRWQVMRDLTGEASNAIAAERSRVATEGWGARLLARQSPGGHWGGGPRGWRDDLPKEHRDLLITLYSLSVLMELGLDPASKQARKMIERVDKRLVFQVARQPALSFTGKPSPASTAESSASARISRNRTTRWPSDCWASNSKMAAGTAKRPRAGVLRSTPPFACSKDCSNTNGQRRKSARQVV